MKRIGVAMFGTGALAFGLALGLGFAPAEAARKPARPSKGRDVVKTIAEVASGRAQLVVGDTGPAVSAVQTRLNVAGIATKVTGTYSKATAGAVSHLQWKFLLDETGRVNRPTYSQLVRITAGRFKLPKNCRNKRIRIIICIDLRQRTLRYVTRGDDTFTIDIRSGRPSQPTRRGHWRIFSKDTYVYSTLYNSPMPYSMFFSGGQALHYSMYFDADGYNGASHGCVNIGSMKQARWLFQHTPMGTGVIVY